MRPGAPVQVTLPSGRSLPEPSASSCLPSDSQTKLGKIRLSLPRNPELRPGGFGRALFTSASASGLTVPEQALRYDADGVSVMVVRAGSEGQRCAGPRRPARRCYAELLQGPPAGALVLLGASFLLEGDIVAPVLAGPVATAVPARPAQ